VKNSASTGSFGHTGAGGAHLFCQPVDLVGGVDHHSDGEADAAGAGLGFGVSVVGELVDGK